MPRGIPKNPIETRKKQSQSMLGKNTWTKGRKVSPETIEKMRNRTGNKNPFFGKKHSQETIEKIRLANTGKRHSKSWKEEMSKKQAGNSYALGYKFSEEQIMSRVKKFKRTFDKKGRTTEPNRLARTQNDYKEWRTSVFERDNYTCVLCGDRGVILNADHIKPFAYYPESRLDIDNGRTLCVPCHKTTDTYAGKAKLWKLKTTN